MTERTLLRLGAASAVVGAIAILVLLAVIPVNSEDYIEKPAEAFQEIATNTFWIPWSALMLISILLVLAGLGTLYRSMAGERGAACAHAGFVVAAVGAALAMVLMGVEGTGLKHASEVWVNGGAVEGSPSFVAAQAVAGVSFGLIAMWLIVFFGVPGFLYGLAISIGAGYPKWLGWLWIVLALGSVAVGFAFRYFTSPDRTEVPGALWLFVLLSLALIAVMGALLWQKAGESTS